MSTDVLDLTFNLSLVVPTKIFPDPSEKRDDVSNEQRGPSPSAHLRVEKFVDPLCGVMGGTSTRFL